MKPLLLGLVVVVIIAGFVGCKKDAKPPRQMTQIVKIVRPPPPPPEQPPPPPPPDKIDEPLPKDTPEEKPAEEAPPSEQLGLDADASGSGDSFGLAARKGGRDLLGSGSGVFAWYTGLVKDSILDALSEDERVRHGNYSVTVKVWLSSDGRVENVKLASTSGSPQLDAAIQSALGKLGKMREGPPLEMPQPLTLKIVSRG